MPLLALPEMAHVSGPLCYLDQHHQQDQAFQQFRAKPPECPPPVRTAEVIASDLQQRKHVVQGGKDGVHGKSKVDQLGESCVNHGFLPLYRWGADFCAAPRCAHYNVCCITTAGASSSTNTHS